MHAHTPHFILQRPPWPSSAFTLEIRFEKPKVQLASKDGKLRGAILIHLMGHYRVTTHEAQKKSPFSHSSRHDVHRRLHHTPAWSYRVTLTFAPRIGLFSQLLLLLILLLLSILLLLLLLLLERKHRRESLDSRGNRSKCRPRARIANRSTSSSPYASVLTDKCRHDRVYNRQR
jgi:hypothetical protein